VETSNVLETNRQRLSQLFETYNPLTGQGSPINRFKFFIDSDSFIMLPETMKDEPAIVPFLSSSLSGYLSQHNAIDLLNDALEFIARLRIKHDFEFWCFTCVPITDKLTKGIIPFKLNRAQRKLLRNLEKARLSGKPIRKLLGKARQWGGSTMILFYFSWIQLFHKVNWHSAIVAQVEDQARNIRGMLSRVAVTHPKDVATITLKPYEGSSKNKVIKERGNIIGIGSVEKPDNLRSFDFAMLHLSEVGLWGETIAKSPEDLAQSLKSTVPKVPYSIIIKESTAKGVGNYWHREWTKAKDGRTGYGTIFIPWFEIEMYTKPIPDYEKFIKGMDQYAWFLWESGATLEGINWYFDFMHSEGYSEWRMKGEYPTNDIEMFQSTGNRVFAQNYVLLARRNCMEPAFVGELTASERYGPGALKNIDFQASPKGRLLVWAKPDTSIKVANRYVLFADIGGKTDKADWSTIKVYDRYPMIDGGVPEVVAVWRGHLDQDLFAWIAAQIGAWYNNALVAIESNKLRKDIKAAEGDFFLTVLDEIAPHYPNLYARNNDPDRVKQGMPLKYGFHTTAGNKERIISTLNKALREELYIERHELSCDEMDTFENKPDGSMGAVEGAHDDMVIVTAGGLFLCFTIDKPVTIKPTTKKSLQRNASEAVI
jgi:hypothetical protein